MKNDIIIPSSLVQGARVRIVSPSGSISPDIIDSAVTMLCNAGYEVIVGKHAKAEYCRFAGTDAERLADLQEAFDDDRADLILCSRGGYGATRIIGNVNLEGFARHPKWVVGFSDITAIHSLLQTNGFASLHAPMLKHLTEHGWEDRYVSHIFDILYGREVVYDIPCDSRNRMGTVRGTLRGGNLAVLSGLRGTRFDYSPAGTVLFIEDIGERPYQIDRMLWNMKHGGIFDGISGLIVGHFTGYEDDMSMGKTTCDLIAEMVSDYDFPVCFGFPVGHTDDNEPLICGATVELSVDSVSAKLKYLF